MTTKFRYAAYAPNGARIGPIPVPVDSSFSSPMNEVSACTLSYLPNSAGADLLNDFVEVAVEASTDDGENWTEIPNGRYMRRDREYEKITLTGARKYTLPGYGWQLNKAIVWETEGLNEDGKRPFLSATVGIILKTLLDEAHARGTILGIDYDFDTILDSAGNEWDKIITIYYEPTLSIYSILDNLSQQGMCDWRFQGRTLQVYNADTVMGEDRSESVRLQPGVDIKALPVKASIEGLVNKALVIGDGGAVLELENPAVLMPWGNWETAISNGGVSDPGTMTLLGTALLEDGGAEKVQFTCELKMDTTSYNPFSDYTTGHYISGPNEQVGGFQSYRVRQINGRSDKNGRFQVDLVVNDRFVEREIRNAKKTNGIVGGTSAGGSGGRPTPPPNPGEGQDTRTPAQVTGLALDSDAYIDHNGRPAGTISATWTEVNTATNATALDVVGYEVAVRPGTTVPWTIVATVEGTSWSGSPYTPAETYQVKVRAVGKYTTTPGIWSAEETIVVASDVTAPSIPSKPTVTTRLGVITVMWDGLNEVGGGMQADFSYIEIAMGSTATPTVVIDTLDRAGFKSVTDQPYDENRYFRFRSVDTSGNISDWSVASDGIATSSVVDADLVDTTIQESIEEALIGPIDGSRINPWSVLGDRVLIGDVDNRIPWNPQVSVDPHVSDNDAVIDGVYESSTGWAIEITGGTGTDGSASPALLLQSGTEDGLFVVEPGRAYRVGARIAARGTFAVSREAFIAIAWYDRDQAYLGSYFGPPITPPILGSATTSDLFEAPFDAEFCRIEVWKNTWSGTGRYLVMNPYMVLAANAELIVDGAITAVKIAAGAIEADKIAANAVTADAIEAGAIDGMVITGATIRTSSFGGRIEMVSDEFAMYDNSGTKQLSITPGSIWVSSLMDMAVANLGRGISDLAGTKLLTMGTTPTTDIGGMVPGMGAGNLLLVEPMQYDETVAAGRVEAAVLNSGGALGGTNSYVLFGNRDGGNGAPRFLGTGGVNIDNAAQVAARSQGLFPNENVDYSAFTMKGDGPAYYGGTSFPNGAAPIISMQRSTSATWDATSGSSPRMHMGAGMIYIHTAGASGFRHLTHEYHSTVVTGAGTGTTTQTMIVNDRGVYVAHGTTGNAANAYVSSTDGRIYRSSSASKYKRNIKDLVLNPSDVLKLRPRMWQDKWELEEDPDTTQFYPGFVAEEVEEAGLGLFVTYDAGEAEGIAYDRIATAQHFVLSDHEARLAELEKLLLGKG